ncbi:uncharacterized protein YcgI (DUF1989 family) [Natronocella acetinitrilica]|uniref:Uncharacterized protein YcgI (DUF1989 family) n=1 Tax=Natronocella acetinitrilica TaxID=414046 RepID=A0AAE3KBR7_9GAMM|nr:uncharacterized protein YcgI (DUF1989 family) [Natronocella acetinitrilica]
MIEKKIEIPAGHGKAVELRSGDHITIVMVEGPQVADTWAFCSSNLDEYVSTEHTRSCLDRLTPRAGQAFYSNQRRPLLTIVEDTSPGVHDLLLSACDQARYTLLGHPAAHRNCVDNLVEALAELGLTAPEIPSPINIFEHVAIRSDGELLIEPPLGRAGDTITLRAEDSLAVVVSACPMDIVSTNGADRRPKPLELRLERQQ